MPIPDPKRLRRAVTCAVVFDDRGRVLLHRRTDNGRWALPGGAIEIDQSAEQTVVREVLEETGYIVEVVRLIGIYSDPVTSHAAVSVDTMSPVILPLRAQLLRGDSKIVRFAGPGMAAGRSWGALVSLNSDALNTRPSIII